MKTATIALVCAAACVAAPADAQRLRQVPCTDQGTARATLEKEHGELPVAIGLEVSGKLFELYAAPSGSFSVLITDANGRSCLVFHGTSMEVMRALPTGDAS